MANNYNSIKGKKGNHVIRHAGSVHVRGMIRRVWRPRYLEVYDDGTVRYYETTPSAASVGLAGSAAAGSGGSGARPSAVGGGEKKGFKQPKLLRKLTGVSASSSSSSLHGRVAREGSSGVITTAASNNPLIKKRSLMDDDTDEEVVTSKQKNKELDIGRESSESSSIENEEDDDDEDSDDVSRSTGSSQGSDITHPTSAVVSVSSCSTNFETQLMVPKKTKEEQEIEKELKKSDSTQKTNNLATNTEVDGADKVEMKKGAPLRPKFGSWDHILDATTVNEGDTKKEESSDPIAAATAAAAAATAISNEHDKQKQQKETVSLQNQKKVSEVATTSALNPARNITKTATKTTISAPSSGSTPSNVPLPVTTTTTTTTTTKPKIQQHRHRPKTVMHILSARIIDPSSLRDIHVGLPKGSWGFVFRGQKVSKHTSNQLNGTVPSSSSHGGQAPAATSVNTATANYQYDRSEFVCHPPSTPKNTPLDDTQSRDYLCAVPTAEEANSWLVALKWAASKTRDTAKATAMMASGASTAGVTSRGMGAAAGSGAVDSPFCDDDDDEDCSSTGSWTQNGFASIGRRPNAYEDVVPGSVFATARNVMGGSQKTSNRKKVAAASKSRSLRSAQKRHNQRELKQGDLVFDDIGGGKPSTSTLSSSPTGKNNAEKTRTKGGGGGGVMVVTKVRRFLLPHLSNWPSALLSQQTSSSPSSLEVVYEIRMLLLRGTTTNRGSDKSQSGKEKNNSSSSLLSLAENAIEEQIVGRTYTQFLDLVRGLIREYGGVVEDGKEIYRLSSTSNASSTTTSPASSPLQALPLSPSSSNRKLAAKQSALEILCQAETELFEIHRSSSLNKSHHKEQGTGVRISHCIKDVQSRHDTIKENVQKIDRILQLLSMNGDICNSALLTEFLDLVSSDGDSTTSSNNKEDPSSPSIKDTNGNVMNKKRTNLRLMFEGESIDDFVKRWLSSSDCLPTPNDHSLLQAFIALQNGYIVLFVATALFLVCVQAMKFWWIQLSFSVTVRIDVFALVLAGVGYAGYEMGCQNGTSGRYDAATNREEPKSERLLAKKDRQRSHQPHQVTVSQKDADKKIDESIETSLVMDTDSTTDEEFSDGGGIMEDLEYEHRGLGVKEDDSSCILNPLPLYPAGNGEDCWSRPKDNIFRVRGPTYLQDRIKIPSATAPFKCRGVEIWLTDNAERHIARHPSMLGGKLGEEDTFIVNFLLPFGNFVQYFSVPPIEELPPKFANIWSKFVKGDQEYRDARLKLLPVVIDGPWIVKKAVGAGTAPAVLGKVMPLQYYFTEPKNGKKGVYEVDVIIAASRIAKGILNVVKGHTSCLTIAFAFIIEAVSDEQLPETVLCSFQVHSIHLEECQPLPQIVLDT